MYEKIKQKIKKIFEEMNINNSTDIHIPSSKIEQVIGQKNAVMAIKNAIQNRRHVLLIGEPGTGKSLLAASIAQQLNIKKQQILSRPNILEPEKPHVFRISADIDLVQLKQKYIRPHFIIQGIKYLLKRPLILFLIVDMNQLSIMPTIFQISNLSLFGSWCGRFFQRILNGLGVYAFLHYFLLSCYTALPSTILTHDPFLLKLLKSHVVWKPDDKFTGFVWSTGTNANTFGDVKHDPYKGIEISENTPDRICKFLIPGSIHKANAGVLYIDEIGNLMRDTQYEFLTILQEKKSPIKSTSANNSNAFVTTNALTCDFCLVLAGNLQTVSNLHPALRSRITAYGYQVYMDNKYLVTQTSIREMLQYLAQEIKKHNLKTFTRCALQYLLYLAIRDSGSNSHFTLKLRDFTGYMSAANDICTCEQVTRQNLEYAMFIKTNLEKQILARHIHEISEYEPYSKKQDEKIGVINILAILSTQDQKTKQGIVKVGYITETNVKVRDATYNPVILEYIRTNDTAALTAFDNVNAYLPRKHLHTTLKFEMAVGGSEIAGDSLGLALLIGCVSRIYGLKIKQNFAVTGAISPDGFVKPVGGLKQKVTDSLLINYDFVIVPVSNLKDVVADNVKIYPVSHFKEVIPLIYVQNKQYYEFETKWKSEDITNSGNYL